MGACAFLFFLSLLSTHFLGHAAWTSNLIAGDDSNELCTM